MYLLSYDGHDVTEKLPYNPARFIVNVNSGGPNRAGERGQFARGSKKKRKERNKNKKNKSARRIKAVVARVTRARNKPLALETSPLIVRTESCADREHDRLVERLVKKIEGGGWRGLGQLRPVRENLSILGTYRRETL